jgi:hypothetical protein
MLFPAIGAFWNGVIASLFASVILGAFVFFVAFRKISDKLKDKVIEGTQNLYLLLNPSNSEVKKDIKDAIDKHHAAINARITEINPKIQDLLNFKNTEVVRREESRRNMTEQQKEISDSILKISDLHEVMEKLVIDKRDMEHTIAQKDQTIAQKDQTIAQKDQTIAQKDQTIAQLKKQQNKTQIDDEWEQEY